MATASVAAAMTAPGSMALAFRLFATDELRVRGMNIIATVGLVGMAVGPIAGGMILAVAPWQALLAMNAPIAAVARACGARPSLAILWPSKGEAIGEACPGVFMRMAIVESPNRPPK